MLQLQQVRTYGKGMLSREERTRDMNLFQIWQERAYCQRLQREANNEEEEDEDNKKEEQSFDEDLE